jgi:hypothetical protein
MSTFSVDFSFEFETYGFSYRPPVGSQSQAFFAVTHNDQDMEVFNITDNPLGLRCQDSDLQIGLATFTEGGENISLDFSQCGTIGSLEIGILPDCKLGGIGIEDLRDAGFNRSHYFGLELEPINIRFDTVLGRLVIEIRDRDTQGDQEEDWYTLVQIESQCSA